jgi:hypothetical protein
MSLFSLSTIDSRRLRMVEFLQRKGPASTPPQFWTDLEACVFERCFPLQQMRDAFTHRQPHNIESNMCCVELIVQMISVARWQRYRKQLSAHLLELRALPHLVSQYKNNALEFCTSSPWDRCPALWTSPRVDQTSQPLPPPPPPAEEIDRGDFMRCRHCGSTNTQSNFVQIRSADEGMTLFIECLNEKCGVRDRQD